MIKELNSLHHKILHNTSFASEVTESEIQALVMAKRLLEQPKTDWIPCEVEMPKEHDSMFAKLKGTDKWNSSMFEKVSDVVNVTIEDQNGKGVTVHACTTDGKWSCDLLRVNKLYRVTAWQPLPAPYKKEGAENE